MTIEEAKDEAAKRNISCDHTWADMLERYYGKPPEYVVELAMEIYTESAMEEAFKHSWVNYLGEDGQTCPCSSCGEETFGKYEGKPSCLRCALISTKAVRFNAASPGQQCSTETP